MGTSVVRAWALCAVAVALVGCATAAEVRGRPEATTRDQQWSGAVAFVTTPSNLVGLTPRTAPERLGSLLTLKEVERNEVQWIFAGLPMAKGPLQKARLVFSPGEAKDEISSIVLTFSGGAAPKGARLFDDLEGTLAAKLGAPRVSDRGTGDRSLMRGWALGADWQVTLKTGSTGPAETIELSVSVQNEP